MPQNLLQALPQARYLVRELVMSSIWQPWWSGAGRSTGPPETGKMARFAGPEARGAFGRLSSGSWASGGVLPCVSLPRDGPPGLPCRAVPAKWPPDRVSGQKNAFQQPFRDLTYLNHRPTFMCLFTNLVRAWAYPIVQEFLLRPPVPAPHGRRSCPWNARSRILRRFGHLFRFLTILTTDSHSTAVFYALSPVFPPLEIEGSACAPPFPRRLGGPKVAASPWFHRVAVGGQFSPLAPSSPMPNVWPPPLSRALPQESWHVFHALTVPPRGGCPLFCRPPGPGALGSTGRSPAIAVYHAAPCLPCYVCVPAVAAEQLS